MKSHIEMFDTMYQFFTIGLNFLDVRLKTENRPYKQQGPFKIMHHQAYSRRNQTKKFKYSLNSNKSKDF